MDTISQLTCPELTDEQISRLKQNDIKTLMHLIIAPPEEVVSIIGSDDLDYREFRKSILTRIQPFPVTLKQLCTSSKIERAGTGIKCLDNILKGGLFPGDMIQLYGKTASGKTQLCLYLTNRICQLQHSTVIYFDLKNDFCAGRLRKIAGGTQNLENVLVFKPYNYKDFLRILDQIKREFASGLNGLYKKCRLMVVDSVPMAIYPVIHKSEGYSWRLYQEQLLNRLQYLADKMKLTVILVNHASTPRPPPGTFQIMDCKATLGKYWEQRVPIRIQLSKILHITSSGGLFEYFSGKLEKCNRGECKGVFNFSINEEGKVKGGEFKSGKWENEEKEK